MYKKIHKIATVANHRQLSYFLEKSDTEVKVRQKYDSISFLARKRRNAWNLTSLAIFQEKGVIKNYMLGSLRSKSKSLLKSSVSFWGNIKIFGIKLLNLSVFFVKQYTSLIFVKENSFCLVNWVFTFLGLRNLFHSVNISCMWRLNCIMILASEDILH